MLKKVVKKFIPSELKNMIFNSETKISYEKETKKIKERLTDNNVFLLGTPEHGNLGDHAIAEAGKEFMEDYFPETNIIEVTGPHFRKKKEDLINLVGQDDKLVITGGGFLGNLWMKEENMVRDVINSFPDNKIVIFPQTMYYGEKPEKSEEFQNAKDIYKNHNELYICLRDKRSYNLVKEKMKGCYSGVEFIPDIATYLDKTNIESPARDGVLFCFRKDKESVVPEAQKEKIEEYILSKEKEITHTDTVISQKVMKEERDVELEKKLKEFKSAEIVITDRLHGMIFAVITETPSVAFNNISGKVRGVYQWLKHLDYIYCAELEDNIGEYIDNILDMDKCNYDNELLKSDFKKLANIIK